jgi:hypothetical protein
VYETLRERRYRDLLGRTQLRLDAHAYCYSDRYSNSHAE